MVSLSGSGSGLTVRKAVCIIISQIDLGESRFTSRCRVNARVMQEREEICLNHLFEREREKERKQVIR